MSKNYFTNCVLERGIKLHSAALHLLIKVVGWVEKRNPTPADCKLGLETKLNNNMNYQQVNIRLCWVYPNG
ncbi:hypothetical protein [Okeania sp. SIO2B3]|uniref:hypothetical protein n=1 Tax=Okeania sp. SIO2B3 TaxID=2607784 RepID=UPI0013C2739C|nr:hypothetical protein [Okeania sp. SIO2B3]NET43613.1 hypothetical protein [Okeania sp. SIO2B3]